MPGPSPTIGELFKAKAITDDQVNAHEKPRRGEPGGAG